MKKAEVLHTGIAALGVVIIILAASFGSMSARQLGGEAGLSGAISGVVTSAKGPEAGVWVIA